MDIKYSYFRTAAGYKIEGKDDSYVVTAGGATKSISQFWHVDNFNPLNFVPTTRTLTINGTAYDLSANRSFTTPDTITRLKGGAAGSLVSGDITLAAGANVAISQTGNTITLASTDTTYSAGGGLTLSGTTFSLPVTTSGTGNVVTGIAQTANGITVYLASMPTAADLNNYIPTSQKGVANGVATLDASGQVPASQLPSYVDDVTEGYYKAADGKFYKEAAFTTLIPGEAGKIYVSLDTNKTYRWTGTVFVYITSGAVDSVNGLTGVVVLNKSHVGLPNVDNTADTAKNVLSATKLTTARTIGVSGITGTAQNFDGSANVVIPITAVPASILTGTAAINTTGSAGQLATPRTISVTGDAAWSVSFDGSANTTGALTLANTGVAAGTYDQVTVDPKGRVTAGTNVVKSYNTSISGTATVIHNLGTKAVEVNMYDTVTLYRIDGRVKITDNAKIDVEFDVTPPNSISITITRTDL
jgi:cytoskeletal protein CcmA (bactofilin family)